MFGSVGFTTWAAEFAGDFEFIRLIPGIAKKSLFLFFWTRFRANPVVAAFTSEAAFFIMCLTIRAFHGCIPFCLIFTNKVFTSNVFTSKPRMWQTLNRIYHVEFHRTQNGIHKLPALLHDFNGKFTDSVLSFFIRASKGCFSARDLRNWEGTI